EGEFSCAGDQAGDGPTAIGIEISRGLIVPEVERASRIDSLPEVELRSTNFAAKLERVFAGDPGDRVGNVPRGIEDVIGKETGADVLIRARVRRACGIAVTGKTDARKGAVLRCIDRQTERRRIERIGRIAIRDVVTREPDVEVIQNRWAEGVVVL